MDEAVLLFVNGLRSPSLDGPLGLVGDWGYLVFPLLLLLLALRTRTKAALRSMLDGWLAYLLALFVVETILKPLVGRARPTSIASLAASLEVLGRASSSPSFPSGTATACAAGVVWLALRHRESPLERGILAFALLIAVAASAARVYAAAHYPTDVVAGWVAGAAVAWAVHRVTSHAASTGAEGL